jgi:hypothetical protein
MGVGRVRNFIRLKIGNKGIVIEVSILQEIKQ